LDGAAEVLPADAERLGRHAHDRADRLAVTPASQRDQVPQELAHRQLVPLGAFLDQAPLEGTPKIQHRPAVERFAAEEDRLLHEAPGHHVDRPADIALDHVPAAVRGGDRAAGRAEIDADVEDIGLLRHLLAPWALAQRGDAVASLRVLVDAVEERARDALAIGRLGEPAGLLVVREAGDLSQDAGALRGDENQEWRAADSLVPD